MKNGSIAFVTALLLAASPAVAQTMTDWDSDANGSLSRDEWSAGMNSGTAFKDWDTDANASISSQEFAAGLFTRFDADADGNLTVAEWDNGFDRWYGEQAVDLDFAAWDADGNGMLTREEFTSQYQTAGLFDQFRTKIGVDGSATTSTSSASSETESVDGLDQESFSNGMFDWMDSNGDDDLSTDENSWLQ